MSIEIQPGTKRREFRFAIAEALETLDMQQVEPEELQIMLGASLSVSLGEPGNVLGIDVKTSSALHPWAFALSARPFGLWQTEVPFYR